MQNRKVPAQSVACDNGSLTDIDDYGIILLLNEISVK